MRPGIHYGPVPRRVIGIEPGEPAASGSRWTDGPAADRGCSPTPPLAPPTAAQAAISTRIRRRRAPVSTPSGWCLGLPLSAPRARSAARARSAQGLCPNGCARRLAIPVDPDRRKASATVRGPRRSCCRADPGRAPRPPRKSSIDWRPAVYSAAMAQPRTGAGPRPRPRKTLADSADAIAALGRSSWPTTRPGPAGHRLGRAQPPWQLRGADSARTGSGARGPVEIEIPKGARRRRGVAGSPGGGRSAGAAPPVFRLYAGQRGRRRPASRPGATVINAPPASPRQESSTTFGARGPADELVSVTIPRRQEPDRESRASSNAGPGVCSKGRASSRKRRTAAFAASAWTCRQLARGVSLPRHLPVCGRTRPAAARRSFPLVRRHRSGSSRELRGPRHPQGGWRTSRRRWWLRRREEIVILAFHRRGRRPGPGRRTPAAIAQVFINRLRFPTFHAPSCCRPIPRSSMDARSPSPRSEACHPLGRAAIRRIHLEDRGNPYNTYTPRGPAARAPSPNPGRAAPGGGHGTRIARLTYISFRKNDGTHYFSRTVAEHEAGRQPLPAAGSRAEPASPRRRERLTDRRALARAGPRHTRGVSRGKPTIGHFPSANLARRTVRGSAQGQFADQVIVLQFSTRLCPGVQRRSSFLKARFLL